MDSKAFSGGLDPMKPLRHAHGMPQPAVTRLAGVKLSLAVASEFGEGET